MTTVPVPLIASAAEVRSTLPGRAEWLETLRETGLNHFRTAGLPGRRTEAWKYTLLTDLKDALFQSATTLPPPALDAVPEAEALAVPGACRVVLVNGRYSAALSDPEDSWPTGLMIESLATLLDSTPGAMERVLGASLALEDLPFAALNTGFVGDGLVIRVAAGAVVERPLHIVHVVVGGAEPLAVQPRLLLLAGVDSVATVLESHVSLGGADAAPTLTNGVSEITVKRGASLTHLLFQNENRAATHIWATGAVLHERAVYDSFRLSLGGKLSRHDVRLTLAGDHAEGTTSGAYAAATGQHMDSTLSVTHAAPHGTSRQVYKGVLEGSGRGVFQGRIHVQRGAQKTDGHQLHKALLLSHRAEVDVKPELTIYADDVTCSHGAAAGELDADALFYLQARGISPEEARALLIEGFLDDVVDQVRHEAGREALKARVHHWLESRKSALVQEDAA